MDLCCSYGRVDPLVFLAVFRVVRVVLLWANFILLEIQGWIQWANWPQMCCVNYAVLLFLTLGTLRSTGAFYIKLK